MEEIVAAVFGFIMETIVGSIIRAIFIGVCAVVLWPVRWMRGRG